MALQNSPEKLGGAKQSSEPYVDLNGWGPNRREAKFFDHTSLDLGARELATTSARIKCHPVALKT